METRRRWRDQHAWVVTLRAWGESVTKRAEVPHEGEAEVRIATPPADHGTARPSDHGIARQSECNANNADGGSVETGRLRRYLQALTHSSHHCAAEAVRTRSVAAPTSVFTRGGDADAVW